MKRVLRRLRLITPFTLELPVGQEEFVQRLRQHVAPPNTNPFGRLGRIFSPTVAPYSGVVQRDYFRLKPRTEGNQAFIPSIEGHIVPLASGTRLEAELRGASGFFLFFALFYLVFWVFALTSLLMQGSDTTMSTIFFILFAMLLQGGFMVGIPYASARRHMQKAAYELERDLFYFVQRPERV
ncbi:hypothetical protein HNQ93_002824 [Hymenobacter luteus]|uniref:Uncharacterized protein n=2 Tax=Hymenobacter TaxID=89966 RepID=A0A7W9WBL6_9BACT|nr:MULTISPECIES: hypothetical protein [Hymenobacter]MBB4601608.1 hypothetical protein [Hymenobacter latericoloratus]MBB6059964.1 hypothetical protein [Hymenobacter luteus]